MATGAAAALTVAMGATATTASAASCYASGGHLYCDNSYNAPIYKAPRFESASGNPTEVVDRLLSTHSYFICWEQGAAHSGGNNVWYYTFGDGRGAYGYVPANYVYTPQDPFPGVNHC